MIPFCTLYGNGIDDDTRAIQELLDSGLSQIVLPVPQNHTGTPIPLMTNKGEIEKLYLYNVDAGEDVLLNDEGTIGKIIEH